MPSSAHPFNIGPQGPTGDAWTNPDARGGLSGYAATGPKGPTGYTGSKGTTGPTGETGPSLIGLTYTSTGANAHHIILQYNNIDGQALTADGGYYRGPTGSSIYYLRGEHAGRATGAYANDHRLAGRPIYPGLGLLFQKSVNGILYLKSITGGNSLKVEDMGQSIRIRYNTFDAVTAHGPTGALAFASKNSAGTTGLSGATLTHYYGGPTYALKMTTRTYNEISNRIPPYQFNEETHTFIYKINPVDVLSLEAAQAGDWNRPSGNVLVVNPNKDYELWFGYAPSDGQKPFVRFIDSSDPNKNPDEYLEKFSLYSSSGFTLIVMDWESLGEITNKTGDDVSYSDDVVFPSNWKFSYSLDPILTSDIDIIQFITLGNKDEITQKIEWYGMYVRTEKEINPFEWGSVKVEP